MTARTLAAGLLLLVAAPLTACGGSTDSAAAGPGAAPGAAARGPAPAQGGGQQLGACGTNPYPVDEPLACLSYDLTGDLTEKGTVVGSMSEAKTCADWVEGSVFGGKPVLKMPTAGGISDGKFLGLKGNVREFAGAGTYPKAQLPNVAVSLGSEGKYELVDASTASLTVKPDGSGSLTFGDYRGEDGAAGTVSGTVTWTCHDPGA